MYKKFFRFVGVICLYSWIAHTLKNHYIGSGILVFSLLICTALFFRGRKQRKQNQFNAQMIKKFERMKNGELVSYRKHLTSLKRSKDAEIYDKECMRRFGFIERKII